MDRCVGRPPPQLDSGDSVFAGPGFHTPSRRRARHATALVPWSEVEEALDMAQQALLAKQRAAEALLGQHEELSSRALEDLELEARRAEADSNLLLDELETLMQAKAQVAEQRAELDRVNSLLLAERDLLCQQLEVAPDDGNLCQAVGDALFDARRTADLEARVQRLTEEREGLAAKLERERELFRRSRAAWLAREHMYRERIDALELARRLPAGLGRRPLTSPLRLLQQQRTQQQQQLRAQHQQQQREWQARQEQEHQPQLRAALLEQGEEEDCSSRGGAGGEDDLGLVDDVYGFDVAEGLGTSPPTPPAGGGLHSGREAQAPKLRRSSSASSGMTQHLLHP